MAYSHEDKFNAGAKQNRFLAPDITKDFQLFLNNPAGATGALKTGAADIAALIGAMTPPWGVRIDSGSLTLDIAAGYTTGAIEIPYDMTLQEVELVALPITGQSTGSIVLDVWVDTYANWPPVVGDSICGAGVKPTISSALKSNDTDLTDWTTRNLTKGSKAFFNVVSCTNLRFVQVKFKALRTGL